MNLKERKMIHRVFKALDCVPGAYIGVAETYIEKRKAKDWSSRSHSLT